MLVAARVTPPLLFKSINPLYMMPSYIKTVVLIYVALFISINVYEENTIENILSLSKADIAFALFTEFSIGLAFWFSLVLTYGALMTMFQLIDMQVGFNPSGIFNPSMNQSEPILSRALIIFTFLLFFAFDVHYLIIYMLSSIMSYYPILSGFEVVDVYKLMAVFSSQMIFSMILVSPVIISVFWVEVILGLCSRMMPQVNIYFVGLPAKVLMSMVTLGLISTHAEATIAKIFDKNFSFWDSLY
ncbi:type III secretion protein [Vibrio sp. OCN044]|uniref:Type III secretion protein n=1 Tax=Vibrio tetraodonis subsp. pristinus TaxID=2695891 RepID=A0A6L8LZW7_9VIBR|nr:type III secretion protein [Vibrio tetraodonis subsp. pristinus]